MAARAPQIVVTSGRKSKVPKGIGALTLCEDAIHLLRLCPLPALCSYFVGAVPFVLGFLYFWGDMSRSAMAPANCAESALATAGLFIWMKTWQAYFAASLRARLSDSLCSEISIPYCARTFLTQALIHSTGLFVIPIAILAVVPFGYAYAFYQNATAFGAFQPITLREVCLKSSKQSSIWVGQNHLFLCVMFLFSAIVYLNLGFAVFIIPQLLKMFLGIDTPFTLSASAMVNPTLLLAISGLTYLCVDPIMKSAYVLSCFYGESLESGADLRAELALLCRAEKVA